MDTPIVTNTLIRFEEEFVERISDTYIELAKLFRNPPSWLHLWLHSYLLPSGRYDVCVDKAKPSRTQLLIALKLDQDWNVRALQAARDASDVPLIRKLSFKANRIAAEIGKN